MLLLVAIIWGFGFVVQRTAMETVGPMTFTAVRFLIGAAVLVPLVGWGRRFTPPHRSPAHRWKFFVVMALAAGSMAAGGILQQVGLVYTSAGVAGFITGLYVVIVPLLGLCIGYFVRGTTWTAAIIATVGLYLLSVQGQHSINPGDGLVLAGAVAWSVQLLAVGWLAMRHNPVMVTIIMTGAAGVLALVVAIPLEHPTLHSIISAGPELAYSGPLAVGLAFLLQVVAQRHAPPAHAAVILAFEAVFGALAGWALLQEYLSGIQIIGCSLMFAGILLSQLRPPKPLQPKTISPLPRESG